VDRSVDDDSQARGFAALTGVWAGRVRIAEDFDELPDDLADALGARDGD
jgi:hypothetical protein